MRRSKRSLEGELLIDHRGSPGVDAYLAQWMGLDPALLAKGQVFETPIVTCGHCQGMVVRNPDRTRERGWCSHCDKYICDACVARLHLTLVCRSVERRIDDIVEATERGTSPLLLPQL